MLSRTRAHHIAAPRGGAAGARETAAHSSAPPTRPRRVTLECPAQPAACPRRAQVATTSRRSHASARRKSRPRVEHAHVRLSLQPDPLPVAVAVVELVRRSAGSDDHAPLNGRGDAVATCRRRRRLPCCLRLGGRRRRPCRLPRRWHRRWHHRAWFATQAANHEAADVRLAQPPHAVLELVRWRCLVRWKRGQVGRAHLRRHPASRARYGVWQDAQRVRVAPAE